MPLSRHRGCPSAGAAPISAGPRCCNSCCGPISPPGDAGNGALGAERGPCASLSDMGPVTLTNTTARDTQAAVWLRNKDIVRIACGGYHMLLLSGTAASLPAVVDFPLILGRCAASGDVYECGESGEASSASVAPSAVRAAQGKGASAAPRSSTSPRPRPRSAHLSRRASCDRSPSPRPSISSGSWPWLAAGSTAWS